MRALVLTSLSYIGQVRQCFPPALDRSFLKTFPSRRTHRRSPNVVGAGSAGTVLQNQVRLLAQVTDDPSPVQQQLCPSGRGPTWEHERITYERASRTLDRGVRIQRSDLLSEGDAGVRRRSWHHLAFEYPADQKRVLDQFVTRASYAPKEYDQIGCPESVR